MRHKFFFLAAVAGIILSSSFNAVSANLVIALPPEKSFVEGEVISLVLKGAQNAVDEIQVSVNNKRQSIAKKRLERFYSCYDGIHLSYGLNTIKVSGFKNGQKVEETSAHVYYPRTCHRPRAALPQLSKSSFFTPRITKKVVCLAMN